jgi:hypothetical protein
VSETPETKEERGATLSPCGRYRYRLWRQWDASKPTVAFVMLNPSTADANQDDPTIRKCIGFAKRWDYGRVEVVNLFAWRATNPKELPKAAEPIGPDNIAHIVGVCTDARMVVAAWGSDKFATRRARDVSRALDDLGVKLHALKISGEGKPWHPLYVPYAEPLKTLEVA